MEINDMKKLETIHVRPLSNEERSRAWNNIAARLPSTPALSPFVFPLHKALSFAAIFIFLIGTVSASDSARPGQLLFPIDRAVERIETTLDPASQANHAQERLVEFDEIIGSQPPQDAAAPAPRMGKVATPSAETMMFSAAMDAPTQAVELSPGAEQAIATTRAELEAILNKALMDDDAETVAKIIATIDEFETKVQAMRGQ